MIGFAMCGSFCTYSQVFPVMELLSRDYHVTPIFSQASYTIDSRFGTASEHIQAIQSQPVQHRLQSSQRTKIVKQTQAMSS